MGGERISLSDKVSIYYNKIAGKVKAGLMNDIPPGLAYRRGEASPSLKEVEALSRRYTLSSILPYECYEDGVYYNRDSVGFMLLCMPATSLSPTELRVLNGIFNNNHKPNTIIQVSLYPDTNIEGILDSWYESKHNGGELFAEMFELMASNRRDYLSSAKWESLFSDQSLILRDFKLIISYTIPVQKGLSPVEVPKEEIDYLKRALDFEIK